MISCALILSVASHVEAFGTKGTISTQWRIPILVLRDYLTALLALMARRSESPSLPPIFGPRTTAGTRVTQ
jgi:hypothetical protein